MLPEVDLNIFQKIVKFVSSLLEGDVFNNLKRLISFIVYPSFPEWVDILKAVSIGLILFGLWILYRGIFLSSYFNRRILWKTQDIIKFGKQKKVTTPSSKKWNAIAQRLNTGREEEFKLAILEADSLLGETLIKMGYKEETIADNIKKVGPEILSNIDSLIAIRQIRNNIIADPDYRINLEQAKKTMAVYEVAFKEMQLI